VKKDQAEPLISTTIIPEPILPDRESGLERCGKCGAWMIGECGTGHAS
jgi:hypothetical protein